MCKNLCSMIKGKYRRYRLARKGIGSFSCNNCEIYFPRELLENMYTEEQDIINIVLRYKGKAKLEQLRKSKAVCFCCNKRFSTRLMGSFVSDKRNELELAGLVKRI